MRLVAETTPFPRVFVWPLAAGLALLAWLARTRSLQLIDSVHCPLRDVTGLACPTCGGTRALVALAEGRWRDGLAANPAVPVLALLLCGWTLYAAAATVVPGWRRQLDLGSREAKAARWAAALLIMVLWAYQVRHLT